MYLTESSFNMGSRFEKDMYSSMLKKISDTNVRQIFDKLLTDLGKKDEIILDLANKVDDLEQRVSAQERYSSKDCLILENLPIVNNQVPLSHQVCDFLAQFLQYKTSPSNFKACHLLGTWKNINYPPAVIVKFLYFGEKSEIYNRKSWLANIRNPNNNKQIFLKERLPPADRLLKQYADDLGLVNTSQNCQVKMFKMENRGIYKSFPVSSKKAIDDMKHLATKKSDKFQSKTGKSTENYSVSDYERNTTPIRANNIQREENIKSILKRLRDSPEQEGEQLLEQLCKNRKTLSEYVVNPYEEGS